MMIKTISQAEMVERARQMFNQRNPFYQIPVPKTEEGIKMAKKVQNQIFWENVLTRVMRKMKWQKLV